MMRSEVQVNRHASHVTSYKSHVTLAMRSESSMISDHRLFPSLEGGGGVALGADMQMLRKQEGKPASHVTSHTSHVIRHK